MTGPIFIVGNGRSGTSVLLNTIRKTLDIPGHGEGHFHPLAFELMTSANRFFNKNERKAESENHLLHYVELKKIKREIRNIIAATYKEQYGTEYFIDKTPGPQGVQSVPFVQDAFPNTKVIFAHRRGIEVVRSAMKKFPHVEFEGHCKIWKNSMANWRTARSQLHVPYLEIDQHDIANSPSLVSKRIGDLLELDEEQVKTLETYFTNDRPQSSGDLNTGMVSLETSGWDEEQIRIFRRNCGAIMTEFGYSEGSDYRVSSE
jgi:hypothetical protein